MIGGDTPGIRTVADGCQRFARRPRDPYRMSAPEPVRPRQLRAAGAGTMTRQGLTVPRLTGNDSGPIVKNDGE